VKYHLSIVTKQDIESYFKGDDWRLFPDGEGFKASGDFAELTLKPVKTIFNVKIENIDDPVDYEEDETEDPIKFIVKYLQTGTEGDEVFRKMSSCPQNVSYVLLLLASELDKNRISPKTLVKNLSKISAWMTKKPDEIPKPPKVPKDYDILRDYSAEHTYEGDDDTEKSSIHSKRPSSKNNQITIELNKLFSNMKSKGWDAKLNDDDITVNIQDLFTAEVAIEKIIWKYEFQIRGFEDTKKSGETEDPIGEFRNYYRDPDVYAAYEEAKEQHAGKKESEEYQATKKPGQVSPYSKTEFDYSMGSPS
jgi:hypothetical protein